MPMTDLVPDRKALANRQASTIHGNDGAFFQSNNHGFTAIEWPVLYDGAKVPGDRFEIDLFRGRNAEGKEKTLGRGKNDHSFSASRSRRSASSRSSARPFSSEVERVLPFRAANINGILPPADRN